MNKKSKLLLITNIFVAIGFAIFGSFSAQQKSSVKVNAQIGTTIWQENYSSRSVGDNIQNSYFVISENNAKWIENRLGSGADYYDIPAYTHAQNFSFTYLASYPVSVDGYNYVEFRGAGDGGANFEFSIHAAGSDIYSSMKNGGTEIPESQSWGTGAKSHPVTPYYGANKYNSIRFVHYNNKSAIYINGVRTSFASLSTSYTPTSILFADYNLNGSKYTNLLYENIGSSGFDFPEFLETIEQYVDVNTYANDVECFSVSNKKLTGNNTHNVFTVPSSEFKNTSSLVFDLLIDSRPATTGYAYVGFNGLESSGNYMEVSFEINSNGSFWALLKIGDNVVYHSGNYGTNPEITYGSVARIDISLMDNCLVVFCNNKVVIKYALALNSSVGAAYINQYQLGSICHYSNMEIHYNDGLSAACEYATIFLSDTASECAARNVKSSTWTTLKNKYSALSIQAKEFTTIHIIDDSGVIRDFYERYLVIIRAYNYDNFLADSSGRPLMQAMFFNNFIFDEFYFNELLIILIAGSAIVTTCTLYVIKKKKR